MADKVHEASIALVREFLSSHKYLKALEKLDDAAPHSKNVITNRSDLAKVIGLEASVKKNKEADEPFSTMLDVLVNDVIKANTVPPKSPKPPRSPGQRRLSIDLGCRLGKGMTDISLNIEDDYNEADDKPKPKDPTPLDAATTTALRKLLFGSADGVFNADWRTQRFAFADKKDFTFGLVQSKAGPCGVITVVQAYILKYLLFEQKDTKSPLEPSKELRTKALVYALSEILWLAGDGKKCVIALPTKKASSGFLHIKADVTEKVELYSCDSKADATKLLTERIDYYQAEESCSVINFTISVLLTHGIDNIKKEMDESSGKLIGGNYCMQELVNLMLTGCACSNVFDGNKKVGFGFNLASLRGVPAQSNIGFLTIYESKDSCKVGDNLKTPKFPIWIIGTEDHFTVAFTDEKDILSSWHKGRFDLGHYDPFAVKLRQLTVGGEKGRIEDSVLKTIQTRWPGVGLSWCDADWLSDSFY